MNRRFRLLAEAHDEEPLGREPGGGVQQDGLICAGLVFAGREHAGGRGLNGRVSGEQRGLRLGVRAFGGLGVGGQYGQQFSLNSCNRGKRNFSPHEPILYAPRGLLQIEKDSAK